MQHGYDDVGPYVIQGDIEKIEAAKKEESDKKQLRDQNRCQIPIEYNSSINRFETKNSTQYNNIDENRSLSQNNSDIYNYIKTLEHNHDLKGKSTGNSESFLSLSMNFDDIVNSIIHLAKTDKEFYALQILFLI